MRRTSICILFLALFVGLGSGMAVGDPLSAFVEEHRDIEWAGTGELWLDPAGNEAEVSDAALRIEDGAIHYTWAFRGTPHRGELARVDDGLTWKDSWHQPETVQLEPVLGHGALLAAEYSYPAGSGPDWHWRIKLIQRPDETLVLQMTNIAPWGEETRAVRMVLSSVDAADPDDESNS